MNRAEAITLIMAGAFVDCGRATPDPLYRAYGGGFCPATTPQEPDTMSLSIAVKRPGMRGEIELSMQFSRRAFTTVKEDTLGLTPDRIDLYSNRPVNGVWSVPIILDRVALPSSFCRDAILGRTTKRLTNGELEGAVNYAARLMLLMQKDPYVRRCIKAMRYGKNTRTARPATPMRDDTTFFKGIRDILGADAVPPEFR